MQIDLEKAFIVHREDFPEFYHSMYDNLREAQKCANEENGCEEEVHSELGGYIVSGFHTWVSIIISMFQSIEEYKDGLIQEMYPADRF